MASLIELFAVRSKDGFEFVPCSKALEVSKAQISVVNTAPLAKGRQFRVNDV